MRARLYLHSAILLFGFTAPLGELIDMHEVHMVWLRMIICTLGFLGYFALRGQHLHVSRRNLKLLIITGTVLTLHWITFYRTINLDGSELTLVLFSTGPVFAALMEPLYFRRRLLPYEFVVSGIAIAGVYIIMQAQSASIEGLVLGLISAALNALYGMFNKTLVTELREDVVNFYTILSGFVVLSLLLPFTPQLLGNTELISLPPTGADWVYLLVLSLVCTNIAYVMCLKGLHGLTPFNFLLAINLEPVYGILLTFLLISGKQTPGMAFWVGAALVAGSVLLNIVYQKRTGRA